MFFETPMAAMSNGGYTMKVQITLVTVKGSFKLWRLFKSEEQRKNSSWTRTTDEDIKVTFELTRTNIFFQKCMRKTSQHLKTINLHTGPNKLSFKCYKSDLSQAQTPDYWKLQSYTNHSTESVKRHQRRLTLRSLPALRWITNNCTLATSRSTCQTKADLKLWEQKDLVSE